MPSVTDFLHEKIQVRLRGSISCINLFQAPKQYRIGIKGFERMNRCLQVSEERNHRDDENDDIRRTQNLP